MRDILIKYAVMIDLTLIILFGLMLVGNIRRVIEIEDLKERIVRLEDRINVLSARPHEKTPEEKYYGG